MLLIQAMPRQHRRAWQIAAGRSLPVPLVRRGQIQLRPCRSTWPNNHGKRGRMLHIGNRRDPRQAPRLRLTTRTNQNPMRAPDSPTPRPSAGQAHTATSFLAMMEIGIIAAWLLFDAYSGTACIVLLLWKWINDED